MYSNQVVTVSPNYATETLHGGEAGAGGNSLALVWSSLAYCSLTVWHPEGMRQPTAVGDSSHSRRKQSWWAWTRALSRVRRVARGVTLRNMKQPPQRCTSRCASGGWCSAKFEIQQLALYAPTQRAVANFRETYPAVICTPHCGSAPPSPSHPQPSSSARLFAGTAGWLRSTLAKPNSPPNALLPVPTPTPTTSVVPSR